MLQHFRARERHYLVRCYSEIAGETETGGFATSTEYLGAFRPAEPLIQAAIFSA